MTDPTLGDRLAAAINWSVTADDNAWPPPELADWPPEDQAVARASVLEFRQAVLDQLGDET